MQRRKTGVRGRETRIRALRQGKEDRRHRYLDEKICFYCRTQLVYFFRDARSRLIEWGSEKTKRIKPFCFSVRRQMNIKNFAQDEENGKICKYGFSGPLIERD
jgi:hypothetical protein